jgi:hypothetical protein
MSEPSVELRVKQLEWVLNRAEEIVRDEHGKDAAYAFTEAWGLLPAEFLEGCVRSQDPVSRPPSSSQEPDWEREARLLFWVNHGCSSGLFLYGDDCEMQCNNVARHGSLDFKRASWESLKEAILAATVRECEYVLRSAGL